MRSVPARSPLKAESQPASWTATLPKAECREPEHERHAFRFEGARVCAPERFCSMSLEKPLELNSTALKAATVVSGSSMPRYSPRMPSCFSVCKLQRRAFRGSARTPELSARDCHGIGPRQFACKSGPRARHVGHPELLCIPFLHRATTAGRSPSMAAWRLARHRRLAQVRPGMAMLLISPAARRSEARRSRARIGA